MPSQNLTSAAYGATLLRVSLAILFFAHLGLKLFVFTPAGFVGYFASLGLPAGLAYLTMTAEFVGGVALLLGIYARVAAIAVVPLILGTIVMVHGHNGFYFNNVGGGWEFPAFWVIGLIVLALIGDGAFALVPTRFTRVR